MLLSIKEMEVRKIALCGNVEAEWVRFFGLRRHPEGASGCRRSGRIATAYRRRGSVQGRVKTDLETECDRCLGRASFHIDAPFDLFYRPLETAVRGEEEVAIDEGEAEMGFYEMPGLELEEIVQGAGAFAASHAARVQRSL